MFEYRQNIYEMMQTQTHCGIKTVVQQIQGLKDERELNHFSLTPDKQSAEL